MDKIHDEAGLLLREQLCFRFYTLTRLIQKAYQPLLEPMGITYPQYLVLLCLWEEDHVPVGRLVAQLDLGTNTLTPLLKRLEEAGLIERQRGREDSRQVILSLTEQGRALRDQAVCLPGLLRSRIQEADYDPNEPLSLTAHLDRLLTLFGESPTEG